MKPVNALIGIAIVVGALSGATFHEVASAQGVEHLVVRVEQGNRSAGSAWEIAIKHALGRLPLPGDPAPFLPEMREARGIEPLPVDEASALHIARLPALHRDPFDRLLVSQAIVHGLTILTPDPLVTQYPALTAW
jgi:PIN domain nuclease of toxin-antitoxin system